MTNPAARTTAADRALSRLPSTIRVGPFDFTIGRVEPLKAHAENRWGSFSGMTQLIEVQCGMPSAQKLVDTFLHEVCHAFFWVYGVGKDDDEERIVSMLGTALFALHRDNPWLSAWISSTLSTSYKDKVSVDNPQSGR